MTAILTHAHGLSLINLSHGPTPDPTPLALPSRFPSTSTPRVTISPSSGHAFLWYPSSTLVWEYDARGRRIGEMQIGKGVLVVTALEKVEGRERVGLGGEKGWRVMEKGKEGKWGTIQVIETAHPIVHIVGSSDSRFIAMASSDGSMELHDLDQTGSQKLSLPKRPEPPIIQLAFIPSSPNTLVVATLAEVFVTTISTPTASSSLHTSFRRIAPFTADPSARVLDFAVSSGSDRKQSGLCAILGEGSKAALISLDGSDSGASDIVDFGQDITHLSFSGHTLIGRSASGELHIRDLHRPAEPATIISLDQPILTIHSLPPVKTKTSRASLASSSTSSTRRILGEARNPSNGQTPPPPPPSLSLDKGKGKQAVRTADVLPRSRSEAAVHHRASLPATTSATVGLRGEGGRAVSGQVRARRSEVILTPATVPATAPEPATTILSAPTHSAADSLGAPYQPKPPLVAAAVVGWTYQPRTTSRIASQPIAPSSFHAATSAASPSRSVSAQPLARPRSRASDGGEASRAPPSGQSPVFDEDIAEEDEEAAESEEEDGLEVEEHLNWAIRDTPPPAAPPASTTTHAEPNEEVLFLRREMARMQMDMLRMSRDIKNEVKMAVKPLVEAMKEQRGMIERQGREIERLRCGGMPT